MNTWYSEKASTSALCLFTKIFSLLFANLLPIREGFADKHLNFNMFKHLLGKDP